VVETGWIETGCPPRSHRNETSSPPSWSLLTETRQIGRFRRSISALKIPVPDSVGDSCSISPYGYGTPQRRMTSRTLRGRGPVLKRIVRLGSIAIPKRSFLAQNQLYDCEHMVFNPWNCLPEHRPLGSVNRMCLAIYLASRQVRRKLNMLGS
jgi:hypothetical protein